MHPRFSAWWRGGGRAAWDYLFSREGRAPNPPTHVSLDLTYRCNLRCACCFLYGSHLAPAAPVVRELRDREEMEIDGWRACIDDLRGSGIRNLVMTGGEVFQKDGFLSLLDHAVRSGCSVSVLSNGTLIDSDDADRLVRIGPSLLRFSLDGDRATHDAICGGPAFDRLLTSLDRIEAAKRRRDLSLPRLGFETVVQGRNQGRLEAVIDVAREKRVASVLFSHLFFTNSDGGGQATRRIARSERTVDARTLAAEIERCRAKAEAHGIAFQCRLHGADDIRRIYDDPTFAPRNKCLYPWMMFRVDPFGDVIPCTGSRRILGSVRSQSIEEIWNGAPYRAFRRELRAAGLFPECAKCNTLTDPRWRFWDALPRRPA